MGCLTQQCGISSSSKATAFMDCLFSIYPRPEQCAFAAGFLLSGGRKGGVK